MIRRHPRSTLSSSSAASDVYKRQLQAAFREDCMLLSLRALSHARHSVCIAAFAFDHPDILDMMDSLDSSISVKVLFDLALADGTMDLSWAERQNVSIRYVRGPSVPDMLGSGSCYKGNFGEQHNKFMILDSVHVLTGSFDFTLNSACNNFENVMVVSDPVLAECYKCEFELMWGAAECELSMEDIDAFEPREHEVC
eukprot:TRINITY_DN41002_c0_g1_i1.p1 TRINITY_DN41002_c0_g1~~TRINITY_DN41002_c0_g1_i1.p1  ORF type:complete len:197 (+),score=47.01 TRINITY_DN41002_c0_g1_i1:67-657(+)